MTTKGLFSAVVAMLLLVVAVDAADHKDSIPITTNSDEARALYLQGRDLLENLRFPEARRYFEDAVDMDAAFALAHLGMAYTAPNAKDFYAALERAEGLTGAVSEGERLMILGVVAGAKSDPERQGDCLQELVAAFPADERAQTFVANYHFGRQDYARAVTHYKKAIKIRPNYAPPYNTMGYAHRFLENYPEAEKAFKKYVELIPDEPNPYDSYAEFLMKLGRFEESIENYEKALALDPNFVASYVGIGNNQIFLGHMKEARKTFKKLYEVARNQGEKRQALTWTAASYVHDGNYDKGLKQIQKRRDIAAKDGDTVSEAADLSLMAQILLESGSPDEALDMYRESVKIIDTADVLDEVKESAREKLLYQEARVALKKHDLKTAKTKAEMFGKKIAGKHAPGDVRLHHELLGLIAIAEGDMPTALAELKQADQQNPAVLYQIAVVCDRQGDHANAEKVCRKAAKFNGINFNYAFVKAKAHKMLAEKFGE